MKGFFSYSFVFFCFAAVCLAKKGGSGSDEDSDSGSNESGGVKGGRYGGMGGAGMGAAGMAGVMGMGGSTGSAHIVSTHTITHTTSQSGADAETIIATAEKKGQNALVKVDLIIAMMDIIEGKLNKLKSGTMDLGISKHPKMIEMEVFLKTHLMGQKGQACVALREKQSMIVMKELYDDVYAKANPVVTKNKQILLNMRETLNASLKRVQVNRESEIAMCKSNIAKCQEKLANPAVVSDVEVKLKVMEASVRTLLKDVKEGLAAKAPEKIETQIIAPVSECMKKLRA